VVYSSAIGWGRDGGVVIIEHLFADGGIYYTQYGHLIATDAYPLPERLTCVEQGAVIGAIGDSRPAPHLHFEVRRADGTNGTVPGPGYTRERPYDLNYRDPGKFLANHEAWLSLWHEWHITIGQERPVDERGPTTPPLVLNDNSVLYLNAEGTILRRATADGRILWRALLETPAVALDGWRGSSLLIDTDGTMQIINVETGGLGDSWQVQANFAAAPIRAGERLLFPQENGGLIALEEDRRTLGTEWARIAAPLRSLVLPDGSLALLTPDLRLTQYSADGEAIAEAQLEEIPSLARTPEGALLVYSLGGMFGGSVTLLLAALGLYSREAAC